MSMKLLRHNQCLDAAIIRRLSTVWIWKGLRVAEVGLTQTETKRQEQADGISNNRPRFNIQ